MSPERCNGAPRSAANDIWSLGATFVEMLSGKRLNYQDNNVAQCIINIVNLRLFIDGKPYREYLKTLAASDFKQIISKTLCIESKRANCQQLQSIARPFLAQRFSKLTLCGESEGVAASAQFRACVPRIRRMSYNSARDELFFADFANHVVRAMRLHYNMKNLRDVYPNSDASDNLSKTRIFGVCYMSDSDTLLICSEEKEFADGLDIKWLVALVRTESAREWREAHRVPIECNGWICHAVRNSHVLVSEYYTACMELLRLTKGPTIEHVKRIDASEKYKTFSSTCEKNTLVAMLLSDNEYVCVHRLRIVYWKFSRALI